MKFSIRHIFEIIKFIYYFILTYFYSLKFIVNLVYTSFNLAQMTRYFWNELCVLEKFIFITRFEYLANFIWNVIFRETSFTH